MSMAVNSKEDSPLSLLLRGKCIAWGVFYFMMDSNKRLKAGRIQYVRMIRDIEAK
jgi:hypothetical protein